MKTFFRSVSVASLLILSCSEVVFAKPLALIWSGPGACNPGCVSSAVAVARKAGFSVQKIKKGFTDYSVFKDAKLWIHPGGKSTIGADAMGPELMEQVREFIYNGGGYVGFCAGAFISTRDIGTAHQPGYGIVPGTTEVYIKQGSEHAMPFMTTPLGNFKMYYAGGPLFNVSEADLKAVDGEVLARYPDGSIAGITAHYGKGKVAVIGTHPEAGFAWKLAHGFVDFKGTRFFAQHMIEYATSP